MQDKEVLSIIDKLIEEEIDLSDERCPFCGAPEAFIDTYEIDDVDDGEYEIEDFDFEDGSGQEDEFEQEDEDSGIEIDDSVEYHCVKCNSSWVIDADGNEYLIEPSDGIDNDKFIHYFDQSMNRGNLELPMVHIRNGGPYLESKDDEVSEVVKGRRVRKRARRKSSAKQRITNLKSKRLKKRKAALGARLRKRVGSSRTKKVTWRDGKYVIVKKDFRGRVKKTDKKNEDLHFDSVKKVDELFELKGKFVRFANKVENPSNFETAISKFNRKFNEPTFENLVEYLNEKEYSEEAKYLKILKENVLNEEENGFTVKYQWGLKNTVKTKHFKSQKEYDKWFDKNEGNFEVIAFLDD